jgi:hypothetical protein
LENSGELRHIFTIRQTLERSSQEGWTRRVTRRGKCGAMLAKFLSINGKTRHSLKTQEYMDVWYKLTECDAVCRIRLVEDGA